MTDEPVDPTWARPDMVAAEDARVDLEAADMRRVNEAQGGHLPENNIPPAKAIPGTAHEAAQRGGAR